jgi:hypothetical protein
VTTPPQGSGWIALGPQEPAFCTRCGAPVGSDWVFCPRCGTPVASLPAAATAPNTERFPTSRPPVAAPVLMGLAAAVTVCALLPAYFRGGQSLASDSQDLWYNIPVIAGWAVATVLLALPRVAEVGAGIAVGATICGAAGYLNGIGTVVGDVAKPGLGFDIGLLGLALAFAGSGFALRYLTRRRRPRIRGLALWATGTAALGVLYDIGEALNWIRIRIHATTGVTFNGSGTSTIHEDCCTLVNARGWDLARTLTILAVAVALPLVAAASFPRLGFGGALIGLALALAAEPIQAFVGLSRPVTAASTSLTTATVDAAKPVLTQGPLPGLWLALVVAVVFLLVGIATLMAGSRDAPRGDVATAT